MKPDPEKENDPGIRAAKTALAELFPDGDYRFHLTLRRGAPEDFFRARDPSGRVRSERARWLAEAPGRYAALRPEGEALLAEFAALCAAWQLAATADLRSLGRELEPDFLLLAPGPDGQFRLCGGVLCFPTGWALEEKVGHTLDFIHGVVPGLNPALAAPISQFLAKLRPGVAFQRDNWGIAATAELNLHPSRALAAPTPPVRLERLWLRVEHQALVALPRAGGVLFGIRLALHRLDEVAADAAARAGLRGALRSMPADLARYKGIGSIRDGLADLLR